MRIELEDDGAGHQPVKVIATELEWTIQIGMGRNEPITLLNVDTVEALCRVLDKALRALEELKHE